MKWNTVRSITLLLINDSQLCHIFLGIDPVSNMNHKAYLNNLCVDAEKHLMEMMKKAFNSQDQIAADNPLFYEVLQHTNFLKEKCESFYGRDALLKVKLFANILSY